MSEIEENSAKSSCSCNKHVIFSSSLCLPMASSLAWADSRLEGLSVDTKITKFRGRMKKLWGVKERATGQPIAQNKKKKKKKKRRRIHAAA